MSNASFPQYAKTNHPDVLASIEETKRLRDEFFEKARVVSEKYTGESYAGYYNGWEYDSVHMTGIQADKLLPEMKTGQWKKPDGNKIEPYRNNPAFKDFCIGYKAAQIPGRGNIMWGGGRMGPGTLFVWDGYVYSYLGFTADLSEKSKEEAETYGWQEVLGSELHKAMEDFNVALKAEKTDA